MIYYAQQTVRVCLLGLEGYMIILKSTGVYGIPCIYTR